MRGGQRRDEPLEIADLCRDAQFGATCRAQEPAGVRFLFGMPLQVQGSPVLGVLFVFDRRTRELSPRERRGLAVIAGRVSERLAVDGRRAAERDSVTAPAARPGRGARPNCPTGVRWAGSAAAAPPGRQKVSGSATGDGAAVAAVGTSRAGRATPDDRGCLVGAPTAASPDGEPSPPPLLRTREVGAIFGVTDRTITNWAVAKRLPSTRTPGGHIRFRHEDVLALRAQVSV